MNQYRSALAISFLYQAAMAGPMSVLSLVLRDQGIGLHDVGYIMAATTVTSAIGTVVSGFAVARYGPLRVIMAALVCAAIALISYEWTSAYALPAFLSRLLQGMGFGLFNTAGIIYVRSTVPASRQIAAVGFFTAMPLVPYFFAQFAAEWYLRRFGAAGLFLVWAFPLLVALAWASWLPREPAVAPPGKTGSYRAALASRAAWPGFLCWMVNGMVWGFGASFMPIMLHDVGLLIGWYFAPLAATALASRFLLLPRLQDWALPTLLALGMESLAAGAMIPSFSLSLEAVILAGVVYGFGYSIIGPTALQVIGNQFAKADQPKPIALANTFFQLGAIAAPIGAGFAYETIGLPLFLTSIGLLGALLGTVLAVGNIAYNIGYRRSLP